MGVHERKQRQRQDREDLILDISLRMLVESGYPGLNMDRVAEEIEYSKGTVYQHFSCKEDIIAGLLCRTTEHECTVMEYALSQCDVPRDRIVAMALYLDHFSTRYPGHETQRMLFNDIHIWSRGNEERRRLIGDQVMREIGLAGAVVTHAYERGDLDPAHISPAESFHGVVSIAMGNAEMKRLVNCFREDTVLTPVMRDFFDNRQGARQAAVLRAYMDGIGWLPLGGGGLDVPALMARIPADVERLIPFPVWSREDRAPSETAV